MTYFFDRNFGQSVARALQLVRDDVEYHDDHYPQRTDDVVWLVDAGGRDWTVITADRHIGSNPANVAALRSANVRCFCLLQTKGHGLNRWRSLERIVRAWRDMEVELGVRAPPFMIGIHPNGSFRVLA